MIHNGDDLSGLIEGLNLGKEFIAREAERAFLTMGLAADPYPAQRAILEGRTMILALLGANQCLAPETLVTMADESKERLMDLNVGDMVMAYDIHEKDFVPAPIGAVFHNDPWEIHRFKHSEGYLECTLSHKVLVMLSRTKNMYHNRLRLRQIRGCRRERFPAAIVRNAMGCPILSEIEYMGFVRFGPTMDLRIDHPDHLFLAGDIVVSNSGKALPNDELVLTPSGFVEMGSLHLGDLVCTPNGGASWINGIYPQGKREVWEISFNDGTSCRCDIDHLWKVRSRNPKQRKAHGEWVVKPLRQILKHGGEAPSYFKMYEVPKTEITFNAGLNLPLDPYALGLLIGDGSIAQSTIGFTSNDPELVEHLRKHLPVSECRSHGKIGWIFTNGQHGGTVKNMVAEHLKTLGLMHSSSKTMFIPDIYKMGSPETRLAILQGLMDTDGTVDKLGCASFTSTSERLSNDVAWVLRSLGERCTVTYKLKHCVHPDGRKTPCDAWEVYIGKSGIPLFRLDRKIARLKSPGRGKPRTMISFRRVEDAECTCITIDGPDKLFVTRDFIPTHNSHTGAFRVAWDATGLYPDWYNGPRTERGIDCWVLGTNLEATRDNCQRKLFGPDPKQPGYTDKPGEEALINSKYIIGKPIVRGQPQGSYDTVRVKHVPSDTTSIITFKSHSMEREDLAAWHGNRAWIDEECQKEILDEIMMRMILMKGQIIITLMPILGATETINFLMTASPELVTFANLPWDQAKHLDNATKELIRNAWQSNPAMLAARTEGRIISNTGLIFPFPVEDIIYDPAKVSVSTRWPRLAGLDPGWHHTAAVAAACDPMSGIHYVYLTYDQSEKPYSFHHSALQVPGWTDNMTFMIDPASKQAGQATGIKILEELWILAHGREYEAIPEKFRKYIQADNDFDSGRDLMWNQFNTRKTLICKNCTDLLHQYRTYEWGKNGNEPRAQTDKIRYDIISALRYLEKGLAGCWAHERQDSFAHRLDHTPPWSMGEEDGMVIDIPSWRPYRAGGDV